MLVFSILYNTLIMKHLGTTGTSGKGVVGLGTVCWGGIGSVGSGSQVVLLVWVGLPKWVRLGIHAGGPSFVCASAEAGGMRRVPAIGFELFF